MKTCLSCGLENPDAPVQCAACGSKLPISKPPEPPKESPGDNLKLKYVDFGLLGEIFAINEGYPYPDWRKIWNYIEEHVQRSCWRDAWRESAIQWLEKLRTARETKYFLVESDNFFLVSRQGESVRKEILSFAEKVRQLIQNRLRGVKFKETFGKQVLIIFEGIEDYYQYISYFYPDGTHAISMGVFLPKGYAHIALPFYDARNTRTALVHELVHNAIFTLPIPRWLNEGLARIFELQVSAVRGTGFDQDMDIAGEHRKYWTSNNIQAFWSGKAFDSPESVKLSYSLSNILIHLVATEKGDFKGFLQNATYLDGGSLAFKNAYDKSLGQIAGIFLGDGDWNPRPEVISLQFAKKNREDG